MFAACETYVHRSSSESLLVVSRMGTLMWGHSTLLYVGRRRDQISHFELLHQEPQGQDYRPWRHCGSDAEDRGGAGGYGLNGENAAGWGTL